MHMQKLANRKRDRDAPEHPNQTWQLWRNPVQSFYHVQSSPRGETMDGNIHESPARWNDILYVLYKEDDQYNIV